MGKLKIGDLVTITGIGERNFYDYVENGIRCFAANKYGYDDYLKGKTFSVFFWKEEIKEGE